MPEASLLLWLTPLLLLSALLLFPAAKAMAYERKPQKPAIVLAAFGTTDVEALGAILNVQKKVENAFPDYDVHLAFTSNMIRDKWHARADDTDFRKNNNVPEEMYAIKNPLTVMALIQEGGSRDILVQSLHITNGSEFGDLKNIVDQLAGIDALQESLKPFPYLAFGDSALGGGTEDELNRAAEALAPLVEKAKNADAALVLMGHGNEHMDVRAYRDFGEAMAARYQYPVLVGLVEGEPDLENIRADLKKAGAKKVLLAPLMLVAGDHAKNDMAGEEDDSWVNILKRDGLEVKIHLEGLGFNDSWAEIYVERLKSSLKQ